MLLTCKLSTQCERMANVAGKNSIRKTNWNNTEKISKIQDENTVWKFFKYLKSSTDITDFDVQLIKNVTTILQNFPPIMK